MTSLSPTVPVLPDLAGTRDLVGALTLEEKIALLTGETVWKLCALPSIGLRPLAMSDGPAGVRGLGEVDGETSILFPAPSAVSATWDVETATTLGRAFASQARERGVDIVLAPQVNIQRTPVGGRHFECYSEDPYLTSIVGTGVVRGLQSEGVAACIKHYVANDSETDRTTYIARVDQQALREVYLAPFEHAVTNGGVWSVMAAYNRVDDGVQTAQMTDHHNLVVRVLKDEFGFDGAVISDWMAAKETVAAALGGLDIVMPGPGGPWEQHLLDAVRAGEVPESVIDDKVARILLLASRVGALGTAPQQTATDSDLPNLVTRIAAQSTVVLQRGAQPPWDRPVPSTIALIGANAVQPHVLGGGSSTVHPERVVSPEEGLRTRFPEATVVVARGGSTRRLAPELDIVGRAGGTIAITSLDDAGREVSADLREDWNGWLRDLPDHVHSVVLRLEVTLTEPGLHYLEVGTVGGHRIVIDGELVSEDSTPTGAEVILNSTINNPEGWGARVHVDGPRTVTIDSTHLVTRAGGYGAIVRAAYRHLLPEPGIDAEIAAAVELAGESDLTIVVVGTNEEVESEGWDRTDLELPGRQNDLVNAVLDADPDAVIVVNAGAPVILPWLDRARTALWTWFPGQEAGHSLAAVIAGDLEPAGRLPWTLPADEADVPVPHARPAADGSITYSDGVHVGYRAWERDDRTPARPFGFGLGWTDWSYDSIDDVRWSPEGDLHVDVTVSNTGSRDGRETVQLYLEAPSTAGKPPVEGTWDRPVRWLAGFTGAHVAVGQSRRVTVVVPRRQFEVWDAAAGHWVRPTGAYRASIGRSVRELLLDTAVLVETPGLSR